MDVIAVCRCLLVCCAIAFAGSDAAHADDAAKGAAQAGVTAFLRGLYAQYAPGRPDPGFLGDKAGSVFTDSLVKLIKLDRQVAKGEVGLIEADPICDCQDYEGLKVKTIEVKPGPAPDRADAVVTFVNTGETTVVRFKLLLQRGQWRIDDVGDSGIPSLHAFLEHGLQKSNK